MRFRTSLITSAVFVTCLQSIPQQGQAIEVDTLELTNNEGTKWIKEAPVDLFNYFPLYGWLRNPFYKATITLNPPLPTEIPSFRTDPTGMNEAWDNSKPSKFPGWSFTKGPTDGLKGKITIDKYLALDRQDVFFARLQELSPGDARGIGMAGAQIQATYHPHPDDPADIGWIQTFTDPTGPEVDRFPDIGRREDDPIQQTPYYYRTSPIPTNFRAIGDLTFVDTPRDLITSTSFSTSVRFQAYLAGFDHAKVLDGIPNDTATIYGGFEWGYDIEVEEIKPKGPIKSFEQTQLSEMHWVVGRTFRDFSGTDLTHSGDSPGTWTNEFEGQFTSTEGSTYQEGGANAGNSVAVKANIDFVGPRGCFLCPWSQIDVGHGAEFWVKGEPGIPIVVEREAAVQFANFSELEPVNTYDVRLQVANQTAENITDPVTQSGLYHGISGPETMVIDGETYSFAYSFNETSSIWHNSSAGTQETILGQQKRDSTNRVWIDEGMFPFASFNSPFEFEEPASSETVQELGLSMASSADLPTIPVGIFQVFTSTSYDPDDGTGPGDGIWYNEWTLRSIDSPEVEPLVSYGGGFEFLFERAGSYSLTLRTVDDEGMSSTATSMFTVVPEPTACSLALLGLIGLLGGWRRRRQ